VLTVSQCCGNAYVNFSRVERSERGPRKSRSDNPFLLLFVPPAPSHLPSEGNALAEELVHRCSYT
jgi:hypothetical protein